MARPIVSTLDNDSGKSNAPPQKVYTPDEQKQEDKDGKKGGGDEGDGIDDDELIISHEDIVNESLEVGH